MKLMQYATKPTEGSGWCMYPDHFLKLAVFQFESNHGYMVTINIIYIVVLLANFNFFFEYQAQIVPPMTLAPLLNTPTLASVGSPATVSSLSNVDHTDFQKMDKADRFKDNVLANAHWETQQLAQQVSDGWILLDLCIFV